MNEPQEIIKKCPNCNKLISGRTDKVFCDDKCRNNFYYKVNNDQIKFIRDVNTILLRNRGILRSLNPSGRTSASKSYLKELGFDFSCFTGIYKTKKGKEYYLVYDHAYGFDDDEKVSLVVFYRDPETIES